MATAKLDGRLVSLINGHYQNETSLWNLDEGYLCNFHNFLKTIVEIKVKETFLVVGGPAVALI